MSTTRTHRRADTELADLRNLLPRGAERIWVEGLPQASWAPDGLEVTHEADGSLAAEAGFDVVVCGEETLLGLGAERVFEKLKTDGRLIVARTGPPGTELEPTAFGEGATDNPDALVRRLSEAAFAVLREGRLGEQASASLDREGRFQRFLVARRDPFTIRAYQAGDEHAIQNLFETCFQHRRSGEHWRWKYTENPFGARHISLAWGEAGELASHYAGYPMPFRGPDGSSRLCLQMGDTMSHPGVRNQGRGHTSLLARTIRHFFATYTSPSYAFYFGFNTGAIHRFSQRFVRGHRLGPVGFWRRGAEGGIPVARTAVRVERVSRLSPAWDRLFARAAPHYRSLVQRDRRYLDWRYMSCPESCYLLLAAYRWRRLVGWSVFRRRDGHLLWGDALFLPNHVDAAGALLAAALEQPEAEGATEVHTWFPKRPEWWSSRLPGLGFEQAPEPQDLALVYRTDFSDPVHGWLEELYYTMGDGDLF